MLMWEECKVNCTGGKNSCRKQHGDETELTACVRKKGPKTHRRLKTKQNKRGCEFSRKSSFSKLLVDVSLVPTSFCKNPAGDRDKWFVCFCVVRSSKKEDFLENSRPVLFCLIAKRAPKSVLCNLLCVFANSMGTTSTDFHNKFVYLKLWVGQIGNSFVYFTRQAVNPEVADERHICTPCGHHPQHRFSNGTSSYYYQLNPAIK